MKSYVRNWLPLLMIAFAVSACGGDNPAEDKTAGGQTGGEQRHGGEACLPNLHTREISFETEGPGGFSAATALAKFGPEHVASGSITGRGTTNFHATMSYRGRTRAVCERLVVDVSLSLRSEDGSFNETIATELTVYSLASDARVSASLPSQEVRGSYRALLPNTTEQSLSVALQYKPDLTGWISIEPAASSGGSSVLATF